MLKKIDLKKALTESSIINLSFGIIMTVYIIWLASNNALNDWYLQTIKFTFSWARSHGIKDSSIIQLLINNIWMIISKFFSFQNSSYSGGGIWTIFPIILLYIFVRMTIFNKRIKLNNTDYQKYFLLTLITLASWAQYFPVNCSRHLFWAMSPGFIILFLFIKQLFKIKVPYNIHYIFRVIISLLLIYEIGFRMVEAFTKFNNAYFNRNDQHYVKVNHQSVLKGMIIEKKFYDCVPKFEDHLKTILERNPQFNIINLTPYAIYSALISSKIHPHSLFVNWNYLLKAYPNYISEIEEITKNNNSIIFEGGHRPLLVPGGYIKDNYQVFYECGGIKISIPNGSFLI